MASIVRAGSPRIPIGERTPLRSGNERDEAAFWRVVQGHRAALHSHCYRMLGSLRDAEDAVQETMLRAWRGLPRFQGRSSLSTWLHRIATNVCIDAIGRRSTRVAPVDSGRPVPADQEEPIVDGAAGPHTRYEEREATELALIAAFQHLPPRQRAVLLLREVLGFSAKEVSEILESTVAATNSALQRARRRLAERIPGRSQQATLRSVGDARVREMVERFTDAFEHGDVEGILELLVEDARSPTRTRSTPAMSGRTASGLWVCDGSPA